jgi:predicted DsbA family dithiol-disulfide isomerase
MKGVFIMKITYWSDYACPYCYIGEERLKKAIANIPGGEDIEIEMKAFQLDPAAGRHAAGDTQTRFAAKYGLSMEHAARSIEHISKMGREEGLDFRYATTLFTNTMDAHRLTKLAAAKGDQKLTERVIERLFAAYFTDNKELADRNLLIRIGEECGLDADEIRAVLDTDQYQDEVILDEREAARYGIHAVPFFAIGQYGISGAQSVEGLEAAIKEVLKEQKEAEASVEKQTQNAPMCGPDGCRMG